MLVWVSLQRLGNLLPDAAPTALGSAWCQAMLPGTMSTCQQCWVPSACGQRCLGKDCRRQAHLGCCIPNNSLTTFTCLLEHLVSPHEQAA